MRAKFTFLMHLPNIPLRLNIYHWKVENVYFLNIPVVKRNYGRAFFF